MNIKTIRAGEYPVSTWAGGTTTQLYIYPEQADYKRRDFIFRLSSATVECEKSEFTALPQVDRIIMVLQGSLHLCYEGHGEAVLQPYEQASFDGGWNTVSYGRATDFNLMLREGAKGRLEVVTLAPGAGCSLENPAGGVMALYLAQGACALEAAGVPGALGTKDLAVTQDGGTIRLCNEGGAPCRVVCARVAL